MICTTGAGGALATLPCNAISNGFSLPSLLAKLIEPLKFPTLADDKRIVNVVEPLGASVV